MTPAVWGDLQASVSASFMSSCIGVLVNATVPSLSLMLFWAAIPAAAAIASCVVAGPVGTVSWILFTRRQYQRVLNLLLPVQCPLSLRTANTPL